MAVYLQNRGTELSENVYLQNISQKDFTSWDTQLIAVKSK